MTESAIVLDNLLTNYWWLLILISLWSLPWKGVALWKAARQSSILWFAILLVVNTVGLLEIFYIFIFSKNKIAGDSEK
jgi:hypothetical protein